MSARISLMLIAASLLGANTYCAAVARATADAADRKDDDNGKVVRLDQIPAKARQAFEKLAGSAKIEEVEIENADGAKIFEASWSVNGVEHEAAVTSDGDVIESEVTIGIDALPQAVQAAAKKAFPNDAKVKIEKKTIVVYEIEAMVGGKEREILIAPTGKRFRIQD